jgi:hypothetical protein
MFKKGLKIFFIMGLVIGFVWQAQAAGPANSSRLDAGEQVYSPVDPDKAAPASAQSVLLAAADDVTILQSELLAYGIPTVDIADVRTYTPSLAELQSYDAVITFPNYGYADPVAMGDVLADYVDSGGGVVLGNWCWAEGLYTLRGRIHDPGYSPFEQVGPSRYTSACLGSYDAGHSLMTGVTAACDSYRDDVIVESGATWVADWNDSTPFVGANAAENVVGITAYPGDYRAFTGDVALLFYNAVNFVSGPQAVWDICVWDTLFPGPEFQFNVEAGNVIRGMAYNCGSSCPAPLTGTYNPTNNYYSFTIGFLNDNSRHYWISGSSGSGYTWGILGSDSSFFHGPAFTNLQLCPAQSAESVDGPSIDK